MTAGRSPSLFRRMGRQVGLSGRLLVLTILFVMVAEVLIYVPSVANFRRNWLNDRIVAAQVAALVLDAAPEERLSEDIETRLLSGVGAEAIAVRGGGRRRLLAAGETPPDVGKTVDLREVTWTALIGDAFDVLFRPIQGPIRVIGRGMGIEFVEIVLDQRPLRTAMLDFSRNIAAFAGNPEDASRVIQPTDRADEIGLAEQALAQMEATLADELRQKRRLAELGLAVSKINHELRNMLTTAQLLTDRLERVSDGAVQRVAPRLVATLDRAIAFCEATLAYGRATERLPQRRLVPLQPLTEELEDLPGLAPGAGIAVDIRVPPDLMVDADPDQLSRVLVNLVRNAIQALSQAGTGNGPPRITVSAEREDTTVAIVVEDNGPGVPDRARAHLFSAFQGSVRSGGTGLGLAITAELVRLHGGTISLDDTAEGARFRLTIPDREAEEGS